MLAQTCAHVSPCIALTADGRCSRLLGLPLRSLRDANPNHCRNPKLGEPHCAELGIVYGILANFNRNTGRYPKLSAMIIRQLGVSASPDDHVQRLQRSRLPRSRPSPAAHHAHRAPTPAARWRSPSRPCLRLRAPARRWTAPSRSHARGRCRAHRRRSPSWALDSRATAPARA